MNGNNKHYYNNFVGITNPKKEKNTKKVFDENNSLKNNEKCYKIFTFFSCAFFERNFLIPAWIRCFWEAMSGTWIILESSVFQDYGMLYLWGKKNINQKKRYYEKEFIISLRSGTICAVGVACAGRLHTDSALLREFWESYRHNL